ncbi:MULTISPECIES: DUF4097 family beta strand repeat-containing protein [unclassified Luteimonas]
MAHIARIVRLTPIALALAAVAAPAYADDECRHSAPQNLTLDLAGATTVMFDIGPHKLRVDASASPSGTVSGRACASSADRLDSLTVSQERSGDKLIVRLQREGDLSALGFGKRYAYLTLEASVPDDVLVQLVVGSGDAWVTGAAAASADVGSGDVELKRIGNRATVKVGSGDVAIDDAGALKVLSIGSGDVEASNLRGDAELGSIGSGDFKLRRSSGSVSIQSVGSGDAELSGIAGDVSVGSIGSGDLDAHDIGGDLSVSSLGSGDIDHRDVRGAVDLPRSR